MPTWTGCRGPPVGEQVRLMFAAQTQACIIVISVYKKEDKIVILYLVENFKDVRTTVAGKLKNP